MRVSILYTVLGGLFLAISHIWQLSAGLEISWLSFSIPLLLLLASLYIGIVHMRSINHGHMAFREGFFTGLNISIGSGIFAGLLFWFYFTDIDPEVFESFLNRITDDKEAYAQFGSQALLGFAFRIFLVTMLPGVMGSILFGFVLRTRRD